MDGTLYCVFLANDYVLYSIHADVLFLKILFLYSLENRFKFQSLFLSLSLWFSASSFSKTRLVPFFIGPPEDLFAEVSS
jgi:hypothetical protein